MLWQWKNKDSLAYLLSNVTLLLQSLNPFKRVFQMTGNRRTKSTNSSISNSSSGDLLFVSFVLFSSSSLVFSFSGMLLNSSSYSFPAVNFGAWMSCLEATTRGVLWRKVGLQNTSGRLLFLLLLQSPYSTVRKSWINFTCRLVVWSHLEKSCWY